MNKSIFTLGNIAILAWAFFGVWLLLDGIGHNRDYVQRRAMITRTKYQIQQVALAAALQYSTQGQGSSLITPDSLVPEYLPNPDLLNNVVWLSQRSHNDVFESRFAVAAQRAMLGTELVAVVLGFSDGSIEIIDAKNKAQY